jgi:hypothetical protein
LLQGAFYEKKKKQFSTGNFKFAFLKTTGIAPVPVTRILKNRRSDQGYFKNLPIKYESVVRVPICVSANFQIYLPVFRIRIDFVRIRIVF